MVDNPAANGGRVEISEKKYLDLLSYLDVRLFATFNSFISCR